MGLREDFNNWPLGRQLQVLFIVSGLLLSLILVVVTKFQLDWLRDKITNDSTDAVEERILVQMEALAKVEGNYLQQELRNYITYIHDVKLLDQIYNDFNTEDYKYNPFNQTTAHSHLEADEDTATMEYGVYYSKYTLTAEGQNLVQIESCFNPIYPFLLISEYVAVYQGYEIGEILVSYPGYEKTSSYTPLVREWYYKASDKPNQVSITEPYIDAFNGKWLISASEAILNNKGEVYGVAAVDITLETLTKKTSSITILDSGFAMLVSSGGMILTVPKIWQPSDYTGSIRIFDTIYTGISESQWETIKNSSSGSRHSFNDKNSTHYQLVKQDILPFYSETSPTHYLLLCVQQKEINKAKDDIDSNFDETYIILFYVTLSIGIAVFITITLLIYFVSRKSANQLKLIEKVFGKVIRRGLFPRITRGMDYKKLEMNSRGIETLVDACKDKLNRIDESEQSFAGYNWGLTRPGDHLLYDDWCSSLYPYNYYCDKTMNWREALPNLTKVLG
jgi:hypothetical protein